jgi:hypothetical protein
VDVAKHARHHYCHHAENATESERDNLANDVRTRTVQPPNDDDDNTDMETVRTYTERMSQVHNVDDSEDGHGDCAQCAKRMPTHIQLPPT